MKRRAPKAFMQAVKSHRHRLEKVLVSSSVSKMKSLYDASQEQLTNHLARVINAGRKDSFTAHQARIVQAQLRQGQAIIAKRMTNNMKPLSTKAQSEALTGLVDDVAALSKAFTGAELVLPVEEAATFAGVITGRASSLMRMNEASMAKYGGSLVQQAEQRLSLSLMTGQTSAQAIDDIAAMVDGEWWVGERIVRTEIAYAYNATHYDGIKASADEFPELEQRWEENCDDSGEPLDDRVAVDSIAMHGQVTPAGGLFTCPDFAPFPDVKGNLKVPQHLAGEQWPFPPSRPNDRAVLSPWMPDWGVPGWRYVGGKRVPV